jgi:hypothetical protein
VLPFSCVARGQGDSKQLPDIASCNNVNILKAKILSREPDISLTTRTTDARSVTIRFVDLLTIAIGDNEESSSKRDSKTTMQIDNLNGLRIIGVNTETKSDTLMQRPISRKSPLGAFCLSFLLPGGGQLYNSQYGKGILMLGLRVGGVVLAVAGSSSNSRSAFISDNSDETLRDIGISVAVASFLWSVIDAPLSANHINKKHKLSRITIQPQNQFANTASRALKDPALIIRINLVN